MVRPFCTHLMTATSLQDMEALVMKFSKKYLTLTLLSFVVEEEVFWQVLLLH